MSEPFVGQVIAVGFNFAPVGWALCDGSLLPICSEHRVVFNCWARPIGGDGVDYIRAAGPAWARGARHGPGARAAALLQGQTGGIESVTLTAGQFASHTHALQAAATATTPAPGQWSFWARPRRRRIYAAGRDAATLAASAVSLPRAAAARMRTGSRA